MKFRILFFLLSTFFTVSLFAALETKLHELNNTLQTINDEFGELLITIPLYETFSKLLGQDLIDQFKINKDDTMLVTLFTGIAKKNFDKIKQEIEQTLNGPFAFKITEVEPVGQAIWLTISIIDRNNNIVNENTLENPNLKKYNPSPIAISEGQIIQLQPKDETKIDQLAKQINDKLQL